METKRRFFGGSRNRPVFSWPLLLRFGLALAAVAGLALVTMVASVMIADTAKDDASAINQAGSLRMQSYRILNLAQSETGREQLAEATEHFERTMSGDAIRRSLPRRSHPLVEHYESIRLHWREELQPLLYASDTPDPATLEQATDTFVTDLEALVRGLQQEAETRIQLLRLIQGIAIFLTLALVFGTMYLLHTGVVLPLRELMDAANRAREGDLGARSSHTGEDEIGLLGRSFNTMAEHLEELYGSLERQVDNKTRDLKRSNDALKLLYDTARILTPEHLHGAGLQTTTERLEQIIETGPVTLCLTQPERHKAYRSYSSRQNTVPGFCAGPACETCMHLDIGHLGSATEPGVAAIPLRDGNNRYGVLLIQYPPGEMPDPWKFRLAEAIADQIASAHSRARELSQQRRLALLDERSMIARELHDSLAQSLSYLKIQVSLLQTQLQGNRDKADTGPILAELREGLNAAYRNLRELLTTFRLKMNEAGLATALEETVNEFSQRGGIPIRLEALTAGHDMDPNMEINILQIVREALANVVKHAHAQRASVSLCRGTPGYWNLTIDDDGIGLHSEEHKSHHYGTMIMRERAESLGGTLVFESPAGGGTRVRAVFPEQAERDEAEHYAYNTDTRG